MKKLIGKEISIEDIEQCNDINKEELFKIRLDIFKCLISQFRVDLHNMQCANEQEHTDAILMFEQEKGVEVPFGITEYFLMKDKIVNAMTEIVRELCAEYLALAKEER